MGREAGVPLMFTLAQMSYWPAKHLGDMGLEAMKVRGRMQEGMVADITIFDPEKVTDNSTYKMGEQGLPTTGVPYVIVSGKMIVKDSKFQKVWAGQPIRFPVEEKGRFEPASAEKWVKKFSINTISVDDSPVNPKSALAALVPGPLSAQQPADAFYFGGDILTMEGKVPRYVEALAVKDGRIAFAGAISDAGSWKGPDTRVVNLAGRTLLPGFVDGHSHIFLHVAGQDWANLSSPPAGKVTNFNDIIQALKEKRHPTAVDLDKAFPDTPVILVHVSGHIIIVNSAALRAKGISAATPDPSGGVMVRLPGSRQPSGEMQENARFPFFDVIFKKEPIDATAQKLAKSLAHYARYGVTTAQEVGLQESQLAVARALAERGQMSLDFVGLVFQPLAEKLIAQGQTRWGTYEKGVKLAGIKLTVNGAPQGKTAYLSKPYLTPVPGCDGDCRGVSALDAKKVNELFLLSYKNNVQVYAHCNGDAAIDLMLAGHEYALAQLKEAAGEKDRRTVIVHSQIMRPEQLDAYAKYRIVPSFFTNHTFFWGDVHLANLGEERASFISPMRSALDKGIRAANHTDYNVTPINQMFTVWTAVNRTTRSGRVLGPEQRITPYEALQAITINGAYMLFEEGAKGSLEPGKLADLVILDRNPLKVDPAAIKDIKVMETIKSGRPVFTLGKP